MSETTSSAFGRIRADLLRVESKGIEPVPEADRHGSVKSLFSMWFSSNVQFATLTSGMLGTAIFGLSIWQTIVAVTLGAALGSACIGAMSRYGPRFGATQIIQSRGPFGFYGNFLIAVLLILKASGWFAVETFFGALILQTLLGLPFGPSFVTIFVVQILIALVGHDLLHAIQRYMSYILPFVVLAASFYGFGQADFSKGFDSDVAGSLGFMGAFIVTTAIQAGRSMSFSAYASDYSRYIKKDSSGSSIFYAAFLGTFIASVWVGALGAAIGTYSSVGSPSDLVMNALPVSLAVVTLVAFGIGNTMNACIDCYSGSMSALILDLPVKRWLSVLLIGTIGGILGWAGHLFGFWDAFKTFLFLLGYWVAPWLGVMLAYFDLNRKGAIDCTMFYDKERRFRAGFFAWIVGFVCSVPFMNQYGLFVGWFAKSHPQFGDITALVGFLVALATCWLILQLTSPEEVKKSFVIGARR